MNFKVGDKVNLRSDLIINKTYDTICFRQDLFFSNSLTIIESEVNIDNTVLLSNGYWYSINMLDLIKKNKKHIKLNYSI